MSERKDITPTPWKLTYDDGSGEQAGEGTGNCLVGVNNETVCFGGNSFGLAIGILKAEDAAFIVTACNQHARLVEALRKIAAWEFDIMGDCVADAKRVATDALAACEEVRRG